jgi:hypothetical protein
VGSKLFLTWGKSLKPEEKKGSIKYKAIGSQFNYVLPHFFLCMTMSKFTHKHQSSGIGGILSFIQRETHLEVSRELL